MCVDHQPATATAEDLAESLLREHDIEHQTLLAVTGNRNRDVLVHRLEAGQAIVDTLCVYETQLTDLSTCPVAASFRQLGADAVTFTSASAVENFSKQASHLSLSETACRPQLISIGPLTTEALRSKGLTADQEATQASLPAVVEATIRACSGRP